MKKTFYNIKTALLLSFSLTAAIANAQNDVGDLFKSGPADATKLINAYLNPLFQGLGSGLNSGWTHTAKTKGFLRFELRIAASGAIVPESDRTYDVNTLGLTNIKPVNTSVSTGPTAFGSDRQGALMRVVDNNGNGVTTFNLPQGLGFHIVPTPQIELTVGLPKHIDVSLRLVPKIKISDDGGKVSMFGVGTKVELLPLLMGEKDKLFPLDVAVALAYSQVKFDLPLDLNNQTASDQRIESKFNGFHFDAIVSKKILFFTPFASIGYQTSSTKLNALGTYTFDVPVTPATPTGKENFTNPVTIDQDGVSGVRATLGFQLKMGFFKILGSYTSAKYDTVNAGISFGMGN